MFNGRWTGVVGARFPLSYRRCSLVIVRCYRGAFPTVLQEMFTGRWTDVVGHVSHCPTGDFTGRWIGVTGARFSLSYLHLVKVRIQAVVPGSQPQQDALVSCVHLNCQL